MTKVGPSKKWIFVGRDELQKNQKKHDITCNNLKVNIKLKKWKFYFFFLESSVKAYWESKVCKKKTKKGAKNCVAKPKIKCFFFH